jgi:hypothetical protein
LFKLDLDEDFDEITTCMVEPEEDDEDEVVNLSDP